MPILRIAKKNKFTCKISYKIERYFIESNHERYITMKYVPTVTEIRVKNGNELLGVVRGNMAAENVILMTYQPSSTFWDDYN